MGQIFYISDIKEKDIKKGLLRINRENRRHFPEEDSDITVVISGVECPSKFSKEESAMMIGKEVIKVLNITKITILTCEKLGDRKFSLANE